MATHSAAFMRMRRTMSRKFVPICCDRLVVKMVFVIYFYRDITGVWRGLVAIVIYTILL